MPDCTTCFGPQTPSSGTGICENIGEIMYNIKMKSIAGYMISLSDKGWYFVFITMPKHLLGPTQPFTQSSLEGECGGAEPLNNMSSDVPSWTVVECWTRLGKSKYPSQGPLLEVKLNLSRCIPWKNMWGVDELFHSFINSKLKEGEQWATRLGHFIPGAIFHFGWTPQPVWMLLEQRKACWSRRDLNPELYTL